MRVMTSPTLFFNVTIFWTTADLLFDSAIVLQTIADAKRKSGKVTKLMILDPEVGGYRWWMVLLLIWSEWWGSYVIRAVNPTVRLLVQQYRWKPEKKPEPHFQDLRFSQNLKGSEGGLQVFFQVFTKPDSKPVENMLIVRKKRWVFIQVSKTWIKT